MTVFRLSRNLHLYKCVDSTLVVLISPLAWQLTGIHHVIYYVAVFTKDLVRTCRLTVMYGSVSLHYVQDRELLLHVRQRQAVYSLLHELLCRIFLYFLKLRMTAKCLVSEESLQIFVLVYCDKSRQPECFNFDCRYTSQFLIQLRADKLCQLIDQSVNKRIKWNQFC